jgi:UDP-GlcNAc:undecaprenyl-phosphate GlcNAc-1-phosphate transferase
VPFELRTTVALGVAFLITYWLTPQMITLAHRLGFVKLPGGRHTHEAPTPLFGGVALFAGVMIPGMLLAPHLGLAVALPLAMLAGLIDDYCKVHKTDLPALPKLVLQFLPATLFVLLGNTITHVSNPFGGMVILPWWIGYPLTMAWLVGMTNAMNFLDGMDGLAAGVVAVASFSLLVIAFIRGAGITGVWVAATLAACVGFLRYNFPPARIFMGDAGSNFLGFLLAAIAVTGYFKAATVAGLAAPIMAFFVPVFNVIFVVIRRMRKGKSFLQALTEGDLEHSFNVLHRRMGFNSMETVLVFLMAAMVASAVGIAWASR